jgi:hypothetical protein
MGHRGNCVEKQGHPLAAIEAPAIRVVGDRSRAVDQFHHEIGQVSIGRRGHAGQMDLGDVGVLESGQHVGFECESSQNCRCRTRQSQQFHRNPADRAFLRRLVHDAHAASAEQCPENDRPNPITGPEPRARFSSAEPETLRTTGKLRR